jgi:hypothetical protein
MDYRKIGTIINEYDIVSEGKTYLNKEVFDLGVNEIAEYFSSRDLKVGDDVSFIPAATLVDKDLLMAIAVKKITEKTGGKNGKNSYSVAEKK